ncbi:methyltransferase TYW3-domain-containing protein [Nemania sp. FL0916]|nr:methyltransferase TYW3-domain-containing protein [Nemania sp. FL0916]
MAQKSQSSSQLPPPATHFTQKKERILAQLAVPEAEYSDASPKGSVDVGIRELIDEINALEGFVTTSSCAGRVSVFVEGRKTAGGGGKERDKGPLEDAGKDGEGGDEGPQTRAAVGGKGGGGTWLFVSHDPVPLSEVDEVDEGDLKALLGLRRGSADVEGREGRGEGEGEGVKDTRLVHFKFEPMILHILTASPAHAQLLLRAGLQAGFRESGAINLVPTNPNPNPHPNPSAANSNTSSNSTPSSSAAVATPMVAIRSMGLSLESLIGMQEDGIIKPTVSDAYLRNLLQVSNERFAENRKRIERFRAAVLEAMRAAHGPEWEDPKTRRERKRAEGLRRQAEQAEKERRRIQQEEEDEEDEMELRFVISQMNWSHS